MYKNFAEQTQDFMCVRSDFLISNYQWVYRQYFNLVNNSPEFNTVIKHF